MHFQPGHPTVKFRAPLTSRRPSFAGPRKLRPFADDKSPMRLLTVPLLGLALSLAPARGADPVATPSTPAPGTAAAKAITPVEPVWEARLPTFDEAAYAREVET